jgi:diguanylate cyclase (GGDEF)-like protein
MNWSESKVKTVSLVAALILASFTFFLLFGMQSGIADADQYIRHHTKIFTQVEDISSNWNKAHKAYQTYLTTGQPEGLRIYLASSQRLSSQVQLLTYPENERAYYSAKFDFLIRKIVNVLESIKSTIKSQELEGMQSTTEISLTKQQEKEMDGLANVITALATDELSLIAFKTAEVSHILSYVRILACLALGLLLLTMLYIFRSGSPRLEGSEAKVKLLENELLAAQKQIEHLAYIDDLTGALNSKGFEQMLSVEQNRCARTGGNLIAILINCDNFKQITTTLGHNFSNSILSELAERIGQSIRPSDHLAHLVGDEFLILLTDTDLPSGARVAERIRQSINDSPLRKTPRPMTLTVSMGLTALTSSARKIEDVLGLARAALRKSKMSGKNRVSIYRESGSSNSSDREMLDSLVGGSNLRVVFQPIINLATNSASGYEIFSRGPDGAFQFPSEFFKVCIENDILTNVDLQCVRRCVESTALITKPMRFHINIFPSTIVETPLDVLLSLFSEQKNTKTFCLELSEPQLSGDPGYLRDQINALHAAGILIAIDDVGFGRSSLDSLIILEPDVVKVDRKYVTGIANDPAKKRLLKRVVNVAKSLGAEIVAEGIESEIDLPVLREIGIDFGQGYFWGQILDELPKEVFSNKASL